MESIEYASGIGNYFEIFINLYSRSRRLRAFSIETLVKTNKCLSVCLSVLPEPTAFPFDFYVPSLIYFFVWNLPGECPLPREIFVAPPPAPMWGQKPSKTVG